MYSRGHAVVGGVASLPLVVLLWPDAGVPVLAGLWVYSVALSVLVDLDHFLVARVTVGDWRNVRRLFEHPVERLDDQSTIFDDDHLTELNRLLSHVLLFGALVAVTWVASRPLGQFTALVLYARLLADLLADNDLV
jgi:hypothetical protein